MMMSKFSKTTFSDSQVKVTEIVLIGKDLYYFSDGIECWFADTRYYALSVCTREASEVLKTLLETMQEGVPTAVNFIFTLETIKFQNIQVDEVVVRVAVSHN
jgi:hypothetical protein